MIDKDFIKNAYNQIIKNTDSKVKLLAVSKYQSIEKIDYLKSLGQTDFGENYLQELEEKATARPDLSWHFIGSLQSRKIKHIVKYVDSIQSVEKKDHLEKIDKAAKAENKQINVFLQINIDNDPNKSGFNSLQQDEVLKCIKISKELKNTTVVGLMCIPAKSITPDKSFKKMKSFFDEVNSQLSNEQKLTRLSMGMSADYNLAIENGSSIVRIGSNLFGERVKKT
ncbi:YggS family pyridoxal phosphate-dependent enzyme [Francisella sp. Scap27]|uniref:YggS family pyridoxal phosphate-dependent enzyme n=1 Tax=Francisella sp. Scap27 TaxID=2589986 RepID=UPI0015C0763A|nr:YggS family pyridoxal phosphate-dependent enzyme [Francisella sp. Scap27]QLE79089.1 YggS family pyridoxal phosphate-dependent enzyme [Francisella sp. Scap27]